MEMDPRRPMIDSALFVFRCAADRLFFGWRKKRTELSLWAIREMIAECYRKLPAEVKKYALSDLHARHLNPKKNPGGEEFNAHLAETIKLCVEEAG